MNEQSQNVSRRSFLRSSTAIGASTFTIMRPELVRGAGKEKLKAGLIGCGGRGTGAAVDLLAGTENVELVAMADLFEDQLEKSLRNLRLAEYMSKRAKTKVERDGQLRMLTDEEVGKLPERVKVGPEHRFVGFDAYKKLIASDIDIVMLCTPPGYRPMHFEAAVEAKKHVFAEKPFGTDPVGVRRFMAAAKKSVELKLTVMAGAQRRSHKEYVETHKRVRDGQLGDILATYAYWIGGPVIKQKSRNPNWGDMEWQHRNWYSYVWLCGDQIVEQELHNLDVVNWFMDAHPVSVVATGGAAWRPKDEIHGNIYDHLSADFVYANGVRMSSYCRQYPGRYRKVGEEIVCAKGRVSNDHQKTEGVHPQIYEHTEMVKSIRGDGPYQNRAMAVAESTMTAIMARESAYSGQEITWDQIMASKLDLMPKAFDYKLPMGAPPLPVPGIYKFT